MGCYEELIFCSFFSTRGSSEEGDKGQRGAGGKIGFSVSVLGTDCAQ